MVTVLDVLHHPRHPGSCVKFYIRTHHRDQYFRQRTCYGPASLNFLTFKQNQRKVYHEVLIAADLSREDEDRAASLSSPWTAFPYGNSRSDTAEFVYGNDTVYFAQPSLSQFVPGGSGAGVFNQSASIDLKDASKNSLQLAGRNAPRSYTGAVLRYAPSTNHRRSWKP